jgi:hypothetical protein
MLASVEYFKYEKFARCQLASRSAHKTLYLFLNIFLFNNMDYLLLDDVEIKKELKN